MAEEDFVVEEMEEEEDTLMNKGNQIMIKKITKVEFNVTIVKSLVT